MAARRRWPPTSWPTTYSRRNLLILTAVKVMDYINRLNTTTTCPTSPITVGSELYEEALVIFKKAELHREAAKALIDYISSIERTTELAEAHRGGRGLGDVRQQ